MKNYIYLNKLLVYCLFVLFSIFVSKHNVLANDNTNNSSNSIKTGSNFSVDFDMIGQMNFDIDDIQYYKWFLVESNDEYDFMYNKFLEQNDPVKKKQLEEQINNKNLSSKAKSSDYNISLTNLTYFNIKNWSCRINNKDITYKNQENCHKNVSIVKVNKQSVLFVMNETNEDILKKIKDIQKEKKPYYTNFYIIKHNTKRVAMFRLFTGQSINLETMQIEDN